jgi:crossover junction endodeoxyribonuclease RuvC
VLIIGIDPGTQATGYGLITAEKSEKIVYVDGGIIPPRKTRDPIARRLQMIYQGLTQILSHHSPDVAAVEDIFIAGNARTALSLGEVRGVILLALAHAGVTIFQYPPREIKKAVVGYGNATKNQVKEMVRSRLQLSLPRPAPDPRTPVPPSGGRKQRSDLPDDLTDALAAAICHLQTQKLSTLIKASTASQRRNP